MEKAALLLICCLLASLSGSPLYPSFRLGRSDTAIVMTSSRRSPAERPERTRPPGERAELRSERHADAIFTNSYRKVLGQISARKFLQTIMGQRPGDSYVKRQADVFEGTFRDLRSVQSDRQLRGHQVQMPQLKTTSGLVGLPGTRTGSRVSRRGRRPPAPPTDRL